MLPEENKEDGKKNKEVLNWKKYLYNENLLTDSLKFKHWDQSNLDIPEK